MNATPLVHSMPNLPGWGAPLDSPRGDYRQALDLVDQLTALSREQRERLARLEALERRLIAAEREAFREMRRAWEAALETGDDADALEAQEAESRWADLKSLIDP